MVPRKQGNHERRVGVLLIEWAAVLLLLTFYAAVITFAFSDEPSIRAWLDLVLS